jgi:Acyl-CoA carboxylase epsilon subunit
VNDDRVSNDHAGEAAAARPLLRVVRGEPDDAELVALTAVVLGIASSGGSEPAAPQRSAWSDHAVLARTTLPHGPGAWRASGFPR